MAENKTTSEVEALKKELEALKAETAAKDAELQQSKAVIEQLSEAVADQDTSKKIGKEVITLSTREVKDSGVKPGKYQINIPKFRLMPKHAEVVGASELTAQMIKENNAYAVKLLQLNSPVLTPIAE